MLYQLSYSRPKRCVRRDGRIRTAVPLLPKQVRYQAAPRPGAGQVYRTAYRAHPEALPTSRADWARSPEFLLFEIRQREPLAGCNDGLGEVIGLADLVDGATQVCVGAVLGGSDVPERVAAAHYILVAGVHAGVGAGVRVAHAGPHRHE